MSYTVMVHIINKDAFLAEIEELPKPTDSILVLRNMRQRDGQPLRELDRDATIVMYPWSRVTFVEVLDSGSSRDELIEFWRDDQ